MNKLSMKFLLRDTLHEAFFTGYQEGNIIDNRSSCFFMTRNKQPMTTGTNRMCISRDDNCVNTMCFPLTTTPDNYKRFAFVAFFDVRETSCPAGKLPFSFLLCDEFF